MSFWCYRYDQNSNENIVRISALKASFFLMILFTKFPGSTKKLPGSPQEATKKLQGRNPYHIFVAILVKTMTPKIHFKINWPSVKVLNITKAIQNTITARPLWDRNQLLFLKIQQHKTVQQWFFKNCFLLINLNF